MDDHQNKGGGMGPPKRSLDELIENMTADLHDSDGQYIQLGFTPPSTPATTQHHWSPHSYLPPMSSHQQIPQQQNMPMYLPEHLGVHPNDQQNIPSYLQHNSSRSTQHQSSLGGLIPGRSDLSDSNYINYVYGNHHMQGMQGLFVMPSQNDTSNNTGMQHHVLNNYVPAYRNENDFGLFMNTPTSSQPPSTTVVGQERNNALIDNLVGNWSSTGSGTYSPFGTVGTPERILDPIHHQQIQPQQLQQVPTPPQQSEERAIPKKRIVAEVRPMRPSYSDIVSKSPPTKPRTLSPNITKMELNSTGTVKPIKVNAKNNKTVGSKKSSTGLKRQLSGDEPMVQKISMESYRSQSPAHNVYHRRVSLEDFDDSAQGEEDEERPDSAQDSSSQSGDNSNKTVDSDKIHSVRAESRGEGGMPLNNHKASKPGVAKRPLHINNNLNLPPRASEKNIVKGGRQCKTCGEERRPGPSSSNSKSESKVSKTRSNSQGRDKPSQHGSGGGRKGKNKKKDCPYSFSVLWPVVHQQLVQWSVVAMRAITWFLHLLSDVLGMSSRLSWHLCGAVCSKLRFWGSEVWGHIRAALPLPSCAQQQQQQRKSRHSKAGSHHVSPPRWWSKWIPSWFPWARKKPWEASANDPPTKLEANLPLPATGEEAMKRLLSCRGKDPYGILGVAPTCTDDDIKRYYKRQAFLVHPDKNSQPGAEEAFKILVHAFDLIGEPEKRQIYDCGVARSHQAEAAWSELSDLLAQLHQKMEEAANTIRCTNCGKRHRRVPVERPCYAARACAQCKIHHAAREGDIWAESTMLGFLWHYYACMEGAVYDITEWAACQADNLRHLRANSHAVQYRIVLGKKHQGSRAPTSRPPEQASEPDLEDFLNSLYGQAGTGPSGARKDGDSPQRQADQARKRKGKRKK